ncbi:MAG TPA: sodium:proton antiporter [Devosia sp.]|nr:sodium:proton antiporter [Devosia sp.]
MPQLNIALAVIALVIILVGAFSKVVKKSLVQEPMLAVVVGVAVGPYGLGWLQIDTWGDQNTVLEQASRLTLAIGLMGVALRLKRHSVRSLMRPATWLLTVGMLGMWLLSSLIAAWAFGLPLWAALLVGAVVTPTDPVVASSIVTGPFAKKNLPLRVRDALSLESGANDGLAYLFVMLAIFMVQHDADEAWGRWAVQSVATGLLGATVIGVAVGWSAARLLAFADKHKTVENASLLGYTVAFSLFTLGMAAFVGADALISVFLAGLVFNFSTDRDEEHEEEHIQEAVAKLFTLPMFVIFGIALPLAEWLQLGWPLLGACVAVLLLRRPPVLALLLPLLRPTLQPRDVAFLGWFGPIGIAAVYYAALARGHTEDPTIWYAASAMVTASIFAHGISAAPLTRLYARHSARK